VTTDPAAQAASKIAGRIGLMYEEQNIARSIIAAEYAPLLDLAHNYARTLMWIRREAPAGWCPFFESELARAREVLGETEIDPISNIESKQAIDVTD
jgi:hypothetical protein